MKTDVYPDQHQTKNPGKSWATNWAVLASPEGFDLFGRAQRNGYRFHLMRLSARGRLSHAAKDVRNSLSNACPSPHAD